MDLPRLCLIEDDPIMGESLCDRFALEGFAIDWYQTATAALLELSKSSYSLVISDIHLPDLSGEELFSSLQASNSLLPPFIFITGYGSIDKAVTLIKQGAADYITKPFDLDLLVDKVRSLSQAPAPLAQPESTPVLGISLAMRRIESSILRIAQHAASVLITGETGVGKEHVAKLLHNSSPEVKDKPFIAVNCGAFSPTLLESELFGHEKGAFTGAHKVKKGVFELADGGTLFLDEIGEMPLNMQVHLLRVLQEKQITRLGGERDYPVNVRLVFATHRDLKEMVKQAEFREDLFYRINIIHLHIPPLRERSEDIIWFSELFLEQCCKINGPHSIDSSAKRPLIDHPWPGNLRELKHCFERACILSDQRVLTASNLFGLTCDISADQAVAQGAGPRIMAHDLMPFEGEPGQSSLHSTLKESVETAEQQAILQSLDQCAWIIGHAAQDLGISRKSLWEKMKRYGIEKSST